MKVGVLQFPGSNCDQDSLHAFATVLGVPARLVWHKEESLEGLDLVVVPGGFSYGDYLRCGAIARFSPVMKALKAYAGAGGMVMGICNGFQILCEAGLLPGALIRNDCLEFRCETVNLTLAARREAWQAPLGANPLRIPVAHGEGNYRIDHAGLAELEANDQILFRYADRPAAIERRGNPNGSLSDIAGICNREGTVIGMMPHPERAVESFHPSRDGLPILQTLLKLAGHR
ncbi:MAG: phosphoribosylformylglycinamidine synthase subunit PurQ [Opitutales bacterium]|nr:phosphoribosylformylglycinamidine synthase subunit PurQ [Opitutales bacterium]